jgi:hypothetical protein
MLSSDTNGSGQETKAVETPKYVQNKINNENG